MQPPTELAVEATGLVKVFGTTRAVQGVDLTVRAGTVYGVLGPNGAGKTTTVRILSTLLRPDAGTAHVAGYDVVRRGVDTAAGDGPAAPGARVGTVTSGAPSPTLGFPIAMAYVPPSLSEPGTALSVDDAWGCPAEQLEHPA